jgi:hypothetical protein
LYPIGKVSAFFILLIIKVFCFTSSNLAYFTAGRIVSRDAGITAAEETRNTCWVEAWS